MIGAIIGDIVGSRFEWNNIKTKEFEFLTYDDSIMSLAIIIERSAGVKPKRRGRYARCRKSRVLWGTRCC